MEKELSLQKIRLKLWVICGLIVILHINLVIMDRIRALMIALMALAVAQGALACTSALVPACKSASGRALMWKHRDSSAESNFVQRVERTDSTHAYVALFNAGDSLLREAWIGMNDTGFAIMNTASYNVAQYSGPEDMEGVVMALALRKCSSVDDFCHLLDTIAKPAGIMANFGVMDAGGALAYIEADDNHWHRYDVTDEVMVRTNFSMGGFDEGGKGYERYDATYDLLGNDFIAGGITPASFTEVASRSFWHGSEKKDYAERRYVPADESRIISRDISTSSVVIEGGAPDDMVMWTVLGFPPCGEVRAVDLASPVDTDLAPAKAGWRSALSDEVNAIKHECTVTRDGKRYYDMHKMRDSIEKARKSSMAAYENHKKK